MHLNFTASSALWRSLQTLADNKMRGRIMSLFSMMLVGMAHSAACWQDGRLTKWALPW
jgi:hypothetical protein